MQHQIFEFPTQTCKRCGTRIVELPVQHINRESLCLSCKLIEDGKARRERLEPPRRRKTVAVSVAVGAAMGFLFHSMLIGTGATALVVIVGAGFALGTTYIMGKMDR